MLKKIIIFILLLVIISCSSNTLYQSAKRRKSGEVRYKTENKPKFSEIKGRTYYLVTSYYGKKFHGRKTANGETFNMYDFTAAHKRFPFGTKLRVTNEDNGKSVIVRVNDRGPFVEGRDLDISYAAARKIGLVGYGVKKLKVEVLGND